MAAVIVLVAFWGLRRTPDPNGSTPSTPAPVRLPVEDRPVIDYEATTREGPLKEMMDQRKAGYGLQDALDLIVTGEETIRIGDQTVSMADIRRQIALKEGRMIETQAGGGRSSGAEEIYGIHLVDPGDNLWNIHFRLLRGYFQAKGVSLAPLADEPRQNGSSSGVGRLLKFSEGMVYVYNLNDRRLDQGIDVIRPGARIVIYRMQQVFALLDGIHTADLERIRFDGDMLWLPARP
jgi:hypothetical protein